MENEKAIALLRNLHESLDTEVKNWLGGLRTNEEKSKLAREIIALANNGGGYVFIGFDDSELHEEIEPLDGELEAFTQDSISGLVHRYVEPACQISVQRATLPESNISHPIITVPGKHRTPLWAKRQSPEGTNTLQTGVVYIRRPGGNSEQPRTQDDWEKLIDRLVRARQTDLVDAVRNVLNPADIETPNALESLQDWITSSDATWLTRVANLSENDIRRFPLGYWTGAFEISGFNCDSVTTLRDFLYQEIPTYTGWPTFVVLQERNRGPVPSGRTIDAWLGAPENRQVSQRDAGVCNYWRVSIDGQGYVVNPYTEDDPDYCSNRLPRPTGKQFDTTYHPYNIVELLFTIRALAEKFASNDSTFTLRMTYTGMENRTLQVPNLRWGLTGGGPCGADIIVSEHSGFISSLDVGIEEEAEKILAPVFENFDFARVNRHAIRHAIEDLSKP